MCCQRESVLIFSEMCECILTHRPLALIASKRYLPLMTKRMTIEERFKAERQLMSEAERLRKSGDKRKFDAVCLQLSRLRMWV